MAANRTKRPALQWRCLDATATELAGGSFTVILDKGTLDALYTAPSDQASSELPALVHNLFTEQLRLLSPKMGRYVTVSLAQPHILSAWLAFFASASTLLRVERISPPEGTQEWKLPVFLLVVTRLLAPNSSGSSLLEYVEGAAKAERHNSADSLQDRVKAAQELAQLSYYARHSRLPPEGVSLTLEGKGWACRLSVVDNPTSHTGILGLLLHF